jgi:hypothetical protein
MKDLRWNLWDAAVNAACLALCRLFPSRSRVIPRADDPSRPLLRQFLLCHLGPLSVYLQHFESPEAWEWFHRHRWEYMRSFVLSGLYLEELPQEGSWEGYKTYHVSKTNLLQRRRFHTHRLYPTTIHRVDYPRGKYSSAEFVHWRDFVKARVPSLETGKIE